jgi:simple sugar transport system ATP-binding protein
MAEGQNPIIELRNASKSYLGVTAVKNMSLALHAGRVLCLLGENGAGKSTVIKMLTGVEGPTIGQMLIDGAPSHFDSPRDARERGIATVYQEVGTLPLMSVARNFVLAAELTKGRGLFRRLDLEKAGQLAIQRLRELGISRVKDGGQLVGTLSGGERQALAIARALHFGARVLVLDEPTAALGVRESATVLRLIERVRDSGVAVVFITHNAYHAHSVGDDFVILRRGEMLDAFKRGDKTVGDIIELMAGGAELKSLLSKSEQLSLRT